MNPLLLLALPEVLKALAPLLTGAAQHGGGHPSESVSNTTSKMDPAVLNALVTAVQRPSEPLPEIKLPRSATVVATIVIIGFFALLAAIAGLLVLGHGEFGAALAVLCVGFGVCASKFGTVVDFLFGSSWGSRQKDARPHVEPASPSIFLSPPVAPAEPEPQPEPPVEPGTWTSTTTIETPVAVDGIGRSTDPSTVKTKSDVPYDGRPAAIRYNNPGAAWESPTDYKFGLIGYGILKDGNHIGRFPHGVNGAAANFALLDRKYVGMDIKKARETWTDDVNFLGVYDPNMVITHEFVRDRNTAIPFLKAVAKWEAGNEYPLSDADWQNAHAMFLAGSADAWLDRQSTKLVKPTDLAAAIVAAMRRKGYVLDTNPGAINIVYVEGLNEDGTVNDDAPDKWNDLRTVIGFDGDKPVVLGSWEATTEPGRYYTDAPVNPAGAARIDFGQYTAWRVGMHRGVQEALVQRGPVTVCRDLNKDMVRTGDARETGDSFGINQHHGYNQTEDSVGKASAGCLVGRTEAGHKAFLSIVKSDPRFVADPDYLFRTAILKESDVVG